jgi:predicted alpha/beta-hydrolase family hydrolase
MFGPVYFLSGDGFSHCEPELERRLAPSFTRWTGQKEIHEPTPESFPLGDYPRRSAHFESYLATREHRRDIVLMGRSSGARLATWYASRHQVGAVICIAYPFRNPTLGTEPDRYLHLTELNVPTLICQGTQDDYGGSNVVNDYAFSPSVRVHFVRTDHNFNISVEAWDTLARTILEFCRKTLRHDA